MKGVVVTCAKPANTVVLVFFFYFLFSIFYLSTFAFAEETEPSSEPSETASSTQDTARINELKEVIARREAEIGKLEEEIAEYQTRLVSTESQKKTLQNAVTTLDLTRAKLAKDIQLTKKKIEQAGGAIETLNRDIANKEAKIAANKKVVGDIIYKIAQSDSDSLVEMLLGHRSISEFFGEIDDLDRLQTAVKDATKTLETLKAELGESKKAQEVKKKSLVKLNSQAGDQKFIADQKRKEQNSLLAQTKNQESSYKKLLAEREARKKELEREIDDFEEQLKVEIDPSSYPPPGTKVLEAPLDKMTITQKFGKTVDARRLYVSGTHNGVDLRASPGTPIKAAGDGTVIGRGDTDGECLGASYGKWILIKHKNGLSSLYAHLELMKVSEGQEVAAGDLIGYSGNTGYSTGPHLHFGLFVSSAVEVSNFPSKSCKKAIFTIPLAPQNAYLNPEDYL